MVKPFSWLYGASQGQECPCGLLVPPPTRNDPDALAEHQRWWCDGTAESVARKRRPRDARGRFVKVSTSTELVTT